MALSRTGRWLVGAICALLVTMSLAATAQAAFPGNNGLIAFSTGTGGNTWRSNADGTGKELLATDARDPIWASNGSRIAYLGPGNNDISIMNPDGSGQTLVCGSCSDLTSNATETRLTWSPDATMLAYHGPAFSASSQIHRVNADGTGQVALTSEGDNTAPASSPDGTRIAFVSNRPPAGIWVMNADGSDQHGLNVATTNNPDWSPDGTQLVFPRAGALWAANSDGTSQHLISDQTGTAVDPTWSPDGTKIMYRNFQTEQLTVINPDGTGITPITGGRTPSWQPIPPGYIRPAGATPVRLSLVPSYTACTTPDRAHGTPLAFGSCAPPQRSSAFLTVGTTESNGAPTSSTGFLQAKTVVGNPATQTDEADVALSFSLSDVRLASDLSDYAGELRARMSLRLTDRDNSPFSAAPGTMIDHVLSLDVTCVPTGGSAGSTCSIQTTADALVPSTVKEGRRMVMELGPAQVFDGGPDGDTSTADNTLFATSGLFVP